MDYLFEKKLNLYYFLPIDYSQLVIVIQQVYRLKKLLCKKINLIYCKIITFLKYQVDADTGKYTTLKEIKELSIRCAIWLRKQNIKTGDVVSLSSGDSLELQIPLLATFYLGAIHNPWEIVDLSNY